MTTMILLYNFKPEQLEQIRKLAPDWTILSGKADTISEQHYRDAEVVCGWNSYVNEALAEGNHLRWVQSISAGINNFPLDQLEEHGVFLTSARGIHPVAMAETLFAMLLSFTRNLHHAIRNQGQLSWKPSEQYSQLTGKTLGIIGAGAIGAEFARLAAAFGMKVLGIRRSGVPMDNVDQMYTIEHLNEVLTQSDFVVNVLPYTEETHHLFHSGRFAHMKRSAIFFNFGRGASVNTDDLILALQQGSIAGAGLDVFETEPLPSDHPLWSMDNVIITPHIAGWTDHHKQKMTDLFTQNLKTYLATGKPDCNVVDYKLKY
jgi:phosphoglycerate dehydrogenase-like enzyme